MSTLVRTQVYLPIKLKNRLKREAKLYNTSFSQILRQYLEEHVEEKTAPVNGAQTLLEAARDAERKGHKGPPDLSTNHDKYLYHENQ